MEKDKTELLYYLKKRLLEKDASDIVIALRNAKKTQIKFVNNQVATTKTWDAANISIFLNYKKRIVATTLQDFTKSAADSAVSNLIKFAQATKPNEEFMGIAKGPFKYKEIEKTYDKKIAELGEDSIDYVERGINAALSVGAKRTNGVLEFIDNSEHLVSSEEVDVEDEGTALYFSIRAHCEKDSSGYSNQIFTQLSDFDPEEAGKEAGTTAKQAMNPEKLKPGKFDVIFSPYPFANFIDHLDSASIYYVEAGYSFLTNMLNKQVASPAVTIYDDGTFPGGLGSSKFDDEGHPTQKTLLIDKGILKTYLHNESTARKYKTKTTGNAGLICPSPNNFVVESGKEKEKQMFADFSGLHITNLWYTRFQNYTTGDFSTIPRDGIFLYKNGEVVKSIKDIRVTENMLNLLKNIAKVSKERRQQCGWEVSAPVITGSALVKDVNITTSTE
ncbi:TldD/PmbA family protein [Candidatus Woesearchaeota archaeon]|nr:TldD/PmbA family protein [Candidatus Woesearchaeota archaeon]